MSEIIDIYDENMKFLGTAEKDEAHAKGLYHKSFHCWLIDGDGRVMLQRRSASKKNFPNLLDVSAAGHYIAGENGKDGAREIREELGFEPDLSRLTEVCVLLDEYVGPKHTNREFCFVYAYFQNKPLSEYVLSDETDGLALVDLKSLCEVLAGKAKTVSAEYFDKATRKTSTIKVKKDDFIPSATNYYYAALTKVQALLLSGGIAA